MINAIRRAILPGIALVAAATEARAQRAMLSAGQQLSTNQQLTSRSGYYRVTMQGDCNLVLYDKCTANYFRDEEEAKRKLQAIEDRWSAIEQLASTNQPAITVK